MRPIIDYLLTQLFVESNSSSKARRKEDQEKTKGEKKAKRNGLDDLLGLKPSPGILHKLLIRGYLKSGAADETPPLQLRRTLDHYFYSHLPSTSKRDSDQVVLRYTNKFVNMEPKIFMVDQLWLWVLDDGMSSAAAASTDR